MPDLRVVGGTDVHDPIDVANDPSGAERVLKAALTEDFTVAVVIGFYEDGQASVFSNSISPDEIIGLIERGKIFMVGVAESGSLADVPG